MLRAKQKPKTKKILQKERFGETLKTSPVEFSPSETGQMITEVDFDYEKVDLTPDSRGKMTT